jgi:hypothetical protein
MPQTIPIIATPSQEMNITLSGQACRIKLYAKELYLPEHFPMLIPSDPPVYNIKYPLFLDLYVNDELILGGARCLDSVKILRNDYLGFQGDLSFYDSVDSEDPLYTELGTRWFLLYWTPEEVNAFPPYVPPDQSAIIHPKSYFITSGSNYFQISGDTIDGAFRTRG